MWDVTRKRIRNERITKVCAKDQSKKWCWKKKAPQMKASSPTGL
ncbi:20356_t:CDS:2, partial [Gigaspora rosea]